MFSHLLLWFPLSHEVQSVDSVREANPRLWKTEKISTESSTLDIIEINDEAEGVLSTKLQSYPTRPAARAARESGGTFWNYRRRS